MDHFGCGVCVGRHLGNGVGLGGGDFGQRDEVLFTKPSQSNHNFVTTRTVPDLICPDAANADSDVAAVGPAAVVAVRR